MNIFILDKDPMKAAMMLCDRHVPKMIVESAQMLSTVHRLLDGKPEKRRSKSGKTIQNKSKPFSIKFEDVSFNYKKNHKTLKSISLEFKAGTKNAIIGSTGSGKTTILSLIGKLYAIDEGKITLNGQDVSELSLPSLREQISIVSQDIVIFDQSLEDNIRYAKLNISFN